MISFKGVTMYCQAESDQQIRISMWLCFLAAVVILLFMAVDCYGQIIVIDKTKQKPATASGPVVINKTGTDRTPVKCLNCPTCGDKCQCFGSGYYCGTHGPCSPEKPLIAPFQPPAGYPAPPAGYEWRRDPRGPDGWGLFQITVTGSVVPEVTTPRPFSSDSGVTIGVPTVVSSPHVVPAPGYPVVPVQYPALTPTFAPGAVLLGTTNCPPSG